jgi:hypothetical protein
VQSAVSRCGVFVNNRHDDTGWAAKVVAEALRRRLGTSSDVFIDNQAIGPGQPFAQVLEDGVRRSEVLVALIGQRWTEPPFMDRLFMADDWVRREILLAKNQQATIVPVLVDRENLPLRARADSAVRPGAIRGHPECDPTRPAPDRSRLRATTHRSAAPGAFSPPMPVASAAGLSHLLSRPESELGASAIPSLTDLLFISSLVTSWMLRRYRAPDGRRSHSAPGTLMATTS